MCPESKYGVFCLILGPPMLLFHSESSWECSHQACRCCCCFPETRQLESSAASLKQEGLGSTKLNETLVLPLIQLIGVEWEKKQMCHPAAAQEINAVTQTIWAMVAEHSKYQPNL